MHQFHLPWQHNVVFKYDDDLDDIVDRAQHKWHGFKLTNLTLQQIVAHMLNFLNIMLGIGELKNRQNDKNRYVLVNFLLQILTMGSNTT